MVRLWSSVVIAALLVLGLSVDAHACRVNMAPDQKIASGYEADAIKAVALVRVKTTHYASVEARDQHAWSARGQIVKSIMGTDLPAEIEFEPDPCGQRLRPEPKAGDAWVVYLWVDYTGQYRSWYALTLDEAREFDPALNDRL